MRRLPEKTNQQLTMRKSSLPLSLLKNQAEPANSNEIWLMTLSDLLMLLMIFFVFLLAVPFVQPSHSQPVVAAAVEPVAVVNASNPIEAAQSSDAAAADQVEKDLVDVLGKKEDVQGLTVERRLHAIILTFPEQILFDSGQAQLKVVAEPTLAAVADFIIGHPELSIEVQGHTDDRPIRTSRYPSNWELSADRAVQVAKTLVQLGANPEKIATKGLGEFHPIEPNTDDAGRLKNRRVEIQFSRQQS
jgi:chemotaxis protein MotB